MSAALKLREGVADGSELVRTLGDSAEFPGNAHELAAVVDGVTNSLGTIEAQIRSLCSRVEKVVTGRPEAAYTGSAVV